MTTKKLLSVACAALFAALCLDTAKVSAQSPPLAADNEKDSLQMVVNYGQGKEKRRRSHHGEMEPVGLPLGQVIEITLEFPKKRAGQLVIVSALDGGRITAPGGPLSVSANGTVSFSFQSGQVPGLYRLLVQGAEQYELHLHAVDPNRPVKHPRVPGAH